MFSVNKRTHRPLHGYNVRLHKDNTEYLKTAFYVQNVEALFIRN